MSLVLRASVRDAPELVDFQAGLQAGGLLRKDFVTVCTAVEEWGSESEATRCNWAARSLQGRSQREVKAMTVAQVRRGGCGSII